MSNGTEDLDGVHNETIRRVLERWKNTSLEQYVTPILLYIDKNPIYSLGICLLIAILILPISILLLIFLITFIFTSFGVLLAFGTVLTFGISIIGLLACVSILLISMTALGPAIILVASRVVEILMQHFNLVLRMHQD